jgi:hypothetical protein
MMFIQITPEVLVDPTRVVAIEVVDGDGKAIIIARHGGGAVTTLETFYYGWAFLSFETYAERDEAARRHQEYVEETKEKAKVAARVYAEMITQGTG